MCGYPSSGKTRRAHELKEYFTQNTERKVHIVRDEDQGFDKNSVYAGEKLLEVHDASGFKDMYWYMCVSGQ